MSAYSSSVKKTLIRNNSAQRSEYNDSILRDSGRADNRLHAQYKEIDRARKVIEADLRMQKKVIQATHTPVRRASCPSAHHSRLQARLSAEKASADERLNKFLARSQSHHPEHHQKTSDNQVTMRKRAQTDPHLMHLGYETTPSRVRDKSPANRKKRGDSVKVKNTRDDDEDEDENLPRRRTRKEFFSEMSKPKHPVQDKKSIRAKIADDMDKTRKTERRMSRPNNDYLQGIY